MRAIELAILFYVMGLKLLLQIDTDRSTGAWISFVLWPIIIPLLLLAAAAEAALRVVIATLAYCTSR